MSFRAFLIMGLFLFLAVCCAPDATSLERISPDYSNQIEPDVPVSAAAATMSVSEGSPVLPATTGTMDLTKTPDEIWESTMPVSQTLVITIIFDNNQYDQRLKTAWGFSALVEYHDHTLLFDAGGDGQILIENMSLLGIDPTQVESLVLSHAHGDHTAGLSALLGAGSRPTVYLPPSFPASFIRQVTRTVEVIQVTPGVLIAEDIYTTGEMGSSIREQALVIQTDQGLVIITGCAHPGIVEIVERSRIMFDKRVHLVLGGFHLGGNNEAEIEAILRDFRRLEVEQVAPCHCTGERAIAKFAAEYGEDFIQAGVGRVVSIDIVNQ